MNNRSIIYEGCRRQRQPSRARLFDEVLGRASSHDDTTHTLALAAALLEDAVRENASDIHLDPDRDGYNVRFRIDGVLVDTVRFERDRGLPLLRALKAHAELDPALTLRPQD